MLKHPYKVSIKKINIQPPSGGCVLKQKIAYQTDLLERPAAFGRLRVETKAIIGSAEQVRSSRLRAAAC